MSNSWLEKYRYYKKGIVKPWTTVTMQKFLQTDPSEEQLMLLDEIDKTTYALVLFIALLYFAMGICFGYVILSSLAGA